MRNSPVGLPDLELAVVLDLGAAVRDRPRVEVRAMGRRAHPVRRPGTKIALGLPDGSPAFTAGPPTSSDHRPRG